MKVKIIAYSLKKPLTSQQRRILDHICLRMQRDGIPPTHEEIARDFGFKSAFSVREHLRLIKKKGYIDLYQNKSRGIKLLDSTYTESRDFAKIPVVGNIAAGQPILAEENIEDKIAVSRSLFAHGVLFALRVQGDSMVKVGIQTGDLAIIRQQAMVENGEIAAVRLAESATLKRVFFTKTHICLKAENDYVKDIIVDSDMGLEMQIVGLYVGLIRPQR